MRNRLKKRILYKPSWISIVIDILILLLVLIIVLDWFPLTTANPYQKYDMAAVAYLLLWFVVSYFLGRYRPLHKQKYFKAAFKLFYTTLLIFSVLWLITIQFFNGLYSVNVIFTYTTVAFGVNIVFYSLYFALLYAVDYDDLVSDVEIREDAKLKPATPLDDDSFKELCFAVNSHSGEKVLNSLIDKFDLQSGNTYVNFSTNSLDLISKQKYKYNVIINLEKLNNIRGINKMFRIVNQKLPDNGMFVCCFESKSTRKKRIFNKYPSGISDVVYFFDFMFKRVMPKMFISRRLYYDITNGRNRILSKTEVLGRLYYCGFEVKQEKKIGDLTYVFSKRLKQPESVSRRSYGPMIKLHRMGKNAEKFEVYKMRTMHPYSEYLQAYIYERNKLQDGGKFNKDIRITTLGRFMRKYWLDELPMLFNLFLGEMKIVGVRPLSAHYFNLYDKVLQEKRVMFKPGLLPPFYADMPKTIEDIQNSEMKYLQECETKGVFVTDLKYFFLILRNIFLKKARSA